MLIPRAARRERRKGAADICVCIWGLPDMARCMPRWARCSVMHDGELGGLEVTLMRPRCCSVCTSCPCA
eukprot:15475039-Alexandrium_andersonii.AAC.1